MAGLGPVSCKLSLSAWYISMLSSSGALLAAFGKHVGMSPTVPILFVRPILDRCFASG